MFTAKIFIAYTRSFVQFLTETTVDITRLAKRREILIFPRTAGNTGNSWETLVIPENYWEIGYSLTKKLIIYF